MLSCNLDSKDGMLHVIFIFIQSVSGIQIYQDCVWIQLRQIIIHIMQHMTLVQLKQLNLISCFLLGISITSKLKTCFALSPTFRK